MNLAQYQALRMVDAANGKPRVAAGDGGPREAGHGPRAAEARVITHLCNHVLLQGLPDRDLADLTAGSMWVTYKPYDVVSAQGMPVDTVLFIAQGRAKAEVSAPAANSPFRAVINFLGPGDDVGLLSLLDGAPHSATVIALEEMRALAVPLSMLQELLASHAEWYRVLADIAVSRLRTGTLWLQALV